MAYPINNDDDDDNHNNSNNNNNNNNNNKNTINNNNNNNQNIITIDFVTLSYITKLSMSLRSEQGYFGYVIMELFSLVNVVWIHFDFPEQYLDVH